MTYTEDSRPTAAELDAMPTLSTGWAWNLKVEVAGQVRIWQHRTGLADGEPYENTITVETYDGDRWSDHAVYDGGPLD